MKKCAPKVVLPGVGEVLLGVGGDRSVTKLAADDADGRVSVVEHEVMPGSGPPLHVHSREDEIFWILEGMVSFAVADKVIHARPGTMVYGAGGTPHTFKNTTSEPAKMLLVVTPAKNFEDFFAQVRAKHGDGRTPSDPEMIERIVRLAPVHGIEIVGPNPL